MTQPPSWGCKKNRQTPRVIIGLWPHISPVTLSHSTLVIKRCNLRLCVVFSVLVTWRQLPRCGPSSPKRLEQQGRQFCEPTCKKKWGEAQCISLSSIRHPPKPNLPFYRSSTLSRTPSTTPQQFSPEEALSTVACASTTAWVSGHRRLDRAWREQQAALSTAKKCANKRRQQCEEPDYPASD